MGRRRTLRRYQELYRNPAAMYPGHEPNSRGPVNVTLWPNGQPEIWLQTPDGLGVRIAASNGPAGLGIQVDAFFGTPEITIASPDGRHLEVCQYRQDARSQAYRRWYLHEETTADVELLGPGYYRDGK